MEESSTRLPVNISGFSGPLELLVHLISKHEMDIFSISLAEITEDFIQTIRRQEENDLDLAGEYLVLAATLIRYKSRALLPQEKTEAEEEEIEDQVLEQRRQEYERFRELAGVLREREQESACLFPRSGPPPEGKGEVVEYTEVSVYDLYQTFQQIIDEIGARENRVIVGEEFSVDEKMLEIEALLEHNDHIVISEYLRTLQSKLEIIVVFLALLELIRLREVRAVQHKNHEEIVLERGEKLTLPLTAESEEESEALSSEQEPTSNDLEDLSSEMMDTDHG